VAGEDGRQRLTEPPGTLMLVDGMGVLMRAIRASSRTAALSHEGRSTGALTIFIGSMTARLKEHRPDSVVVCW
jgi:hypothetical protein